MSGVRKRGSGRALRLGLATCLAWLCTAPTPGDIGGCGQEPQDLDPVAFYAQKRQIDCARCRACVILTETCRAACEPEGEETQEFPVGCVPLVHDGEVCLRALRAASCEDYLLYVDDVSPRAPSECNFCPPRGEP
jgi:hypothetical protein